MEARRILRAVVKGKELLPEHVHEYMKESLARHSAARPLVALKLLPFPPALPEIYFLVGYSLVMGRGGREGAGRQRQALPASGAAPVG